MCKCKLLLLLLQLEVCLGAKNILLIVVDDLRPTLGGYGDPNAYTPNIDALMSDGIVFKEAFAQQALCAPSRNSFLTSRRPDTLHLYDFYSYWRTSVGNFTTLPQYLKENFYDTKSIGKVFHPGKSSNFTDDYPLSWTYPPWHPPTEIYKDAPVCFNKNGWYKNLVCPVRVKEQPGQTLPDIESVTEAIAFLKSRKSISKPFFLAVGFHKPHIPLKFPMEFLDCIKIFNSLQYEYSYYFQYYTPGFKYHPLENVSLPKLRHYPPGLPEVAWNPWTDLRTRHDISLLNLTFPFQEFTDTWIKIIKQSYYAAVSYVDTLIGKLLNFLTVTKLDKNTVVVLIGDHGWSLGEHGEWSKYSNFDVALRVPFVIRVPGLTYNVGKKAAGVKNKEGIISEELVELVDLFPTVVNLVGLEEIPKCPKNSTKIKTCTEGKSLLPLILHEVAEKLAIQKPTEFNYLNQAFSQYPRPGLHPTRYPNSDKPKLREIKIMGYSIRTKRYRYTEWIEWNPINFKQNWSGICGIELYDHWIDFHENLNIANRPGLEEIQRYLGMQLRSGFSRTI